MIKNIHIGWVLLGYMVGLVLLLYIGLNSLLSSAISDSFPNAKFVLSLIFLVVGAWGIGLGIRKYIKKYAPADQGKVKKQFVLSTVFGWLFVVVAIPFFLYIGIIKE